MQTAEIFSVRELLFENVTPHPPLTRHLTLNRKAFGLRAVTDKKTRRLHIETIVFLVWVRGFEPPAS